MMSVDKVALKDFVARLGSASPTPGGGGACAIVGTLGTALGHMVGSLTVGKKKYAAVQEDIIRLQAESIALQDSLMAAVDEDAMAFQPLARAYALPSDTEEEKQHKAEVMEECLLAAAQPPLKIMELCGEAIELQKDYAEKGSRLAISDAGTGVIFCKAAMEGASLNVYVNTTLMKDRETARELNRRADALLEKYADAADEIFQGVGRRLKGEDK